MGLTHPLLRPKHQPCTGWWLCLLPCTSQWCSSDKGNCSQPASKESRPRQLLHLPWPGVRCVWPRWQLIQWWEWQEGLLSEWTKGYKVKGVWHIYSHCGWYVRFSLQSQLTGCRWCIPWYFYLSFSVFFIGGWFCVYNHLHSFLLWESSHITYGTTKVVALSVLVETPFKIPTSRKFTNYQTKTCK